MTTTFYSHWRDVSGDAWRWPSFSAEIACRAVMATRCASGSGGGPDQLSDEKEQAAQLIAINCWVASPI